MLHNTTINRDNIDEIFECFSKHFSQHSNKPIDIYVVGGSSIVINFVYRESTVDIDALYEESEQLNQSIVETANELELPNDWLNHDFINTLSFTNKIIKVSDYYRTYNNMNVYVVKPLYLIAMKLKSSRPTGGDLDDIIKMIYELRCNETDISYEKIMEAYDYLYDDRSNTYDSFFKKTKEAFDVPIEEAKEILKHEKQMRHLFK